MYNINAYFDTQTCAKCVITIHTKYMIKPEYTYIKI